MGSCHRLPSGRRQERVHPGARCCVRSFATPWPLAIEDSVEVDPQMLRGTQVSDRPTVHVASEFVSKELTSALEDVAYEVLRRWP